MATPQQTTSSTSDPAHPSNANENHTTISGEKPTTAYTAIADPSFIPTLDSAPIAQHVKSHLLLLALLISAIVSAYVLGLELVQVSDDTLVELGLGLGGMVAAAWTLLYMTEGHYVDWWTLVVEYWWFSLPLAGGAGLLFVRAQEGDSPLGELD